MDRPLNTDEAFKDSIHAVSANLREADEVATEIIDLFFQLATEKNEMPEHTHKDTIDQFLTSLVAIIG